MPHVVHGPNTQLSGWIADQFPDGYRGYAVDIGASDGKSVNSTWGLEKENRWTVLSIEPNPEFAPALRKERAFVEVCAVGSEIRDRAIFHVNQDNPEAYSALLVDRKRAALGSGPWVTIEVRVESLERLLRKWEFPRLDALCIDAEGAERDILAGFNLGRWLPRVLVLECWEPHDLDGAVAAVGYEWKWRTAHNDCYLMSEGT